MQRGATYYDSTSKSGTENELLVWVQLKEDSKVVLPNFSQLIKLKDEKQDNKVVANLSEMNKVIEKFKNEIEVIEIYRNASSIEIENSPKEATIEEI
jgi:CRISPR-associated protein Csh2